MALMDLLDQSAVAKMLASMSGGQNMPQSSSTFGPMQGAMPAPPPPQGMLQPTPPFNPNAGRSTSPGDDATHEHRKGLLGGVKHLLGADRISPELGGLLTPDQQQRVKPSLARTLVGYALEQRGPESIAQQRAMNMLALKDKKAGREMSVQQQAMMGQIQQVAATMPPQDAAEYMARMKQVLNLPDYADASLAADRTRQPQMQTRANVSRTILAPDGNYYAIQQDPMGNEVPNSRVRVPKPTSGITYKEGVGPDGRPVFYALPSEESGDTKGPIKPRETGVEVPTPPKGDPQTIKLVNNERTLAYDDAVNSWTGLVDEQGDIKDPPGNFDRLATRTEWLNWAATGDGQEYMNNVRKLIRSWVVLVEGKRMSDADARVNELQRSFSFGDKSLVVEGKKQTLASMKRSIEALKTQGALVQPVPGEQAPVFTLPGGRTFPRTRP